MAAVRSLGLVLRSVEVFETSLVVTLFTRELGKVAALAKGARRLKSPFQGGLDLLGVSDIVLLHKASEALDLLTEAAPVERFASLRRDLAALYAGYYIAELLSDLTDFHDPHPRSCSTRRWSRCGIWATRRCELGGVLRFELACLRELGLMPALDACAHCGAGGGCPGRQGGVRAGDGRRALPRVPARPAARRDALGADPGGDPRAGEPGERLARPRPERRDAGAGPDDPGDVISHLLGRRPRLLPYLGV